MNPFPADPADILAPLRRAAVALLDRPLSLWSLLFAVNALFLPYNGLVHDSVLYLIQTLERVYPGSYADDLYLKYGSQDKFSVFSTLAAPLVATFGIHTSFALMYLISNALYLLAVQRLFPRIVPDPLAAVAAMVAVATIKCPFAGCMTFHAYEPFLTPRLMAVVLVLFALERWLAGRWVAVLPLLAAAMALHPLMAFGGVLLFGFFAFNRLPGVVQLTAAVLVGGATVAVLAVPSVGTRFLGTIDPEWHDYIRRVTPYNYAAEWGLLDWVRIAGAVAVCVAARFIVPGMRELAGVLVVIAGLSVGGNVVAENLPYAVPFQGQPYRSLWLVQFLQVPLAWAILSVKGNDPRAWVRVAAGVAAGWVTVSREFPQMWGLALGSGLAFAVFRWRTTPLAAFGFGYAVALVVNSALLLVAVGIEWGRAADFEVAAKCRLVLECFSGPLKFAAAAGLMLAVVRWRWLGVGYVLFGLVPVALFGPGAATELYERLTPGASEVRFVADHIAAHPRGDGRPPTAYMARWDIRQTWIKLGANCYYNTYPLSGLLFNRMTAVEGFRRMRLVRPLELSGSTPATLKADSQWYDQSRVYEITPEEKADGIPTATAADLVRLCEEPDIDWVGLVENFPELHPVTNGKVYLYDARAVREGKARR